MSNITDNPKIQVLKAGCSGVFTNYIYKAIPLAFDESMSYYETLAGLLAYLKDVILPTVNGNAEAVAELQELYIQLNDYVTNYFDNLDVQEEINNKLDKMVEDGTLESILLNYTQVTKVFDTYNDMIFDTSTFVNGMKLKTLGYYFINDGGGAEYFVTNVQNDNKYQISIATNLWIELIVKDNTLYSKQLGLKGDGITDETINLQAFFDLVNYNKVLEKGNYLITNTLYIKGKWRNDDSLYPWFKFEDAKINYQGTEDSYSVILYSMYNQKIDGLSVSGIKNKLGIIGCWFIELNKMSCSKLDISNDVTILNGKTYATLSNEYLIFMNCHISRGLVFNTSESSPYTNAIHFYSSTISGGNEEDIITINGAKHNQAISFNGCDISYATDSYFNIASRQTGRGSIACYDCYFDTSIKMYKNNEPNNMAFTFINNFLASGGNNDKTIIGTDDYLKNVVLGGQTTHGYSLPSMHYNLAKNGNFESETLITGNNASLLSASTSAFTKEWVDSPKNVNNRARKITSLTDTANARLQIQAGCPAPETSLYTVYARFKVLQMHEDGTDISLAVNGQYLNLGGAKLNEEMIIVSNKAGIITEGTSIIANLYFSNPENLIIEFYEVGIIPGRLLELNLPLHKLAKME